MKYFSCFSGIGGFELGITKAYESNISLLNGKTSDGISETSEQSMESTTEGILSGMNSSDTLLMRDTGAVSCVGFSEIDKYATQIYQSHFPTHQPYGDITKINTDELPDFDCLVGGFPCQAFSIAGKRRGFEDTRGTLFFELARILRAKQPRLFVFENVKGLLSHDNGKTFSTIISTIDELGYDCQWQVLNSKNHGVPQNRERIFIIGHLRGSARPQVFPFTGANSKTLEQLVPGSTGMRVYAKESIACTLASQAGGWGAKTGLYNTEPLIRRLTPTECERLQGFPDGWTEGVSDTQRYKCLGNAVTVNVIRDIFTHLI